MRAAFIGELCSLAQEDLRIVLLTGDLGFSVIEPFADRYPTRFLNVGVAEQNMIGVATGLAKTGLIPYVYSIATFAALRPFEFIRNGPVHHRLPVRIVGVGGGFEYGSAGPSHHALEDIGVLRTQPGLTVVSPADYLQARQAARTFHQVPGPVYFRLGKDERRTVKGLDGRIRPGRLEVVREGRRFVVITTGSTSADAALAVERLASEGLDTGLLVAGCIHPAPVDDLVEYLREAQQALVVENHSIVGGLGSLVCEVVAEAGLSCRVTRHAIQPTIPERGGSERFLNDRAGLSIEGISAAALRCFSA